MRHDELELVVEELEEKIAPLALEGSDIKVNAMLFPAAL